MRPSYDPELLAAWLKTHRRLPELMRSLVPPTERGRLVVGAGQLECDILTGMPLAYVYLNPALEVQDILKAFFREVRRRQAGAAGLIPKENEVPLTPEERDVFEKASGLRTGAPDPDPWKNRPTTMRCATCMFYVEKIASLRPPDRVVGRCRRHAPTMAGYPAVFPDDWCGDHKVDEEKL